MPRTSNTANEEFKLLHFLQGHFDGVNALAINPEGDTLLSGSNDGQVIILNIITGEKLQEIDCAFNGQISCATWIDCKNHGEAFVFGCKDGSVHLFKWSSTKGCYVYIMQETAEEDEDEVQNITYDLHHNHIASISRTSIQIWNIPDGKRLKLLQKSPLASGYKGRTVHFCNGASIISTYLETHQVACHTIEPWTLKWMKQIPTRIGHSAFDGQNLLISDLYNGIDQYAYPTMELIRTYPHTIVTNVITQIETISQREWIVEGGDDGFVRIFDMRNGAFLFSLLHGDPGHLVQSVTTYYDTNSCFIITASSNNYDDAIIKIWAHHEQMPQVIDEQPSPPTSKSSNMPLGQSLIIFVIVSIIVNKLTAYMAQMTPENGWDAMLNFLSDFLHFTLNLSLKQHTNNSDTSKQHIDDFDTPLSSST